MAKPKRVRHTDHPIGKKINLVLEEKGIPGDYTALAQEFGVALTSVYGWVEKGRIRKDRLPTLANWSGRSLAWWLDGWQAEDPSSTAERMADKLAEAIKTARIEQSAVAEACGVTKQAVSDWLRTGRIDKKHLPTLARITQRPLAWWLDEWATEGPSGSQPTPADAEDSDAQLLATLTDWRVQASPRSKAVIDQLTALAQRGALREDDWNLIEAMAARLRQTP